MTICSSRSAEAVEGPTGAVGTIGYGDAPRRHLEPAKAVEILDAEIHERETGSAEYRRVGRADAAETLQRSRFFASMSRAVESCALGR